MSGYLIIVDKTNPAYADRWADRLANRADRRSFRLADGVHVFWSGVEARAGQAGIILGDLYPQNLDQTGESADTCQAFQLGTDAATASLRRRFWGDFIALWQDPAGRIAHVYRSPLGRLACYSYRFGTSLILVSNVRDLAGFGVIPKVSWRAVTAHLAGQGAKATTTCLVDIDELIGGQRLDIRSGGSSTEMIWTPLEFCEEGQQSRERAEGVALVRSAILGATKCLVGDRRNIMVGLSGGLDSSIVASALAQTGAAVECVTLVTDDLGGNEETYARMVADSIGARLRVARNDPEAVDVSFSTAADLPRPSARSFSQAGDGPILHAMREAGSSAFFNGGGGDNVFCHMHSVAPVTDRLRREGPGLKIWRTARDVAEITECGAINALRRGIATSWRQSRYYPPLTNDLLTPAACGEVERWRHPWQADMHNMLLGKQMHAYWIASIENLLEGYLRDGVVRSFYPLMTQPVVEACLAVPTWQWVSGGVNRSVAREAFEAELPPIVRHRRSKGTMDGFVAQLYNRHRVAVRDRLLGGNLVRMGVIDAAAVAAALDACGPLTGFGYGRLMALLDVEVWTGCWGAC